MSSPKTPTTIAKFEALSGPNHPLWIMQKWAGLSNFPISLNRIPSTTVDNVYNAGAYVA